MKNKLNKKISIIGAGYVGSTIAYSLMLKNFAKEIVLIDIDKKKSGAEVLDISNGFSAVSSTTIINGSYEDVKNSDLIIVTAGRSRKPGETRLDMVKDNIYIATDIAKNIKQNYNSGIVMVVSNPVDIISYKISKTLNIGNNLVFGTGCVLDTSRLIFSISKYLKCNISDINSMVVGEHGDLQTVLWSKTTINNTPIDEYCKINKIKFTDNEKLKIEEDVTKMGATIISGKGKTYYGISSSVCYIVESIFNNANTPISVSSCLNGELGLNNVCLSVPSIIGMCGIEKRIISNWSKEEERKFIKSAENLKEFINKI